MGSDDGDKIIMYIDENPISQNICWVIDSILRSGVAPLEHYAKKVKPIHLELFTSKHHSLSGTLWDMRDMGYVWKLSCKKPATAGNMVVSFAITSSFVRMIKKYKLLKEIMG